MMSFIYDLKNDQLRNMGFSLIIPWLFIGLLSTDARSQGVESHVVMASATVSSDEKAKISEWVFTDLPDTSLFEALRELERISGIQFVCPEKLKDHFIPARTLEGQNWSSLTKEFLEGYNMLVFYNNAGEVTRVHILGSKRKDLPTSKQSNYKNNSRARSSTHGDTGSAGKQP